LTRLRVRFTDLPKQIAYARLLLGHTAGSGTDVSGGWRQTVPPSRENPVGWGIGLGLPDSLA